MAIARRAINRHPISKYPGFVDLDRSHYARTQSSNSLSQQRISPRIAAFEIKLSCRSRRLTCHWKNWSAPRPSPASACRRRSCSSSWNNSAACPRPSKNSSARSSTRCWRKPTDNRYAINDKARERGPCAVRDRINSLRPLKFGSLHVCASFTGLS